MESAVMPKYQPVTIAYQESGLIRDRQQFVPPNDAYVDLENAYVWRGETKRKFGSQFLGRLRRVLSAETNQVKSATPMTYTSPGASIQSVALFTIYGINVVEPNASLQPGSAASPLVVTLDPGGASETILTDNTGTGALTITGGGPVISVASINYATGVITATFTGATGALNVTMTLAYYPGLPAMGIDQRELNAINAEDSIFFDTRYAYQFSGGLFSELPSTTAVFWTGNDYDFFWFANYWFDASQNKLFWATNGFSNGTVATSDPIRYYNGATWNATPFLPALKSAANNVLVTAKLIIPYRGRLIALNTYEAANSTGGTATVQHGNRARWSQNGDPTNIAKSATGGWVDDVQGRGGFVDAPTNEYIISAAFIRDVLIVYFENSTWKLRYTGNEILPFVWERINIELGAESTNSPVRFDNGILAVGDKGITTCNGNNVERIDMPIRDEVYKIHNDNNGVLRVHGYRNFFEQVVYWTFPAAAENPTYPNRILLYNYDNNTWAFTKDHFTCLGQFQRTNDVRWSDLAGITWEQYKQQWAAGRQQSQFPLIAGGNQQGYIMILNAQVASQQSLYVTGVTAGTPVTITCPNHNMQTGDIVEINDIISVSGGNTDPATLNGQRYQITVTTGNAFTLQQKPRTAITAMVKGATTSVTSAGNTLAVGDLVQFSGITGALEFNNRTATVLTAGATFTCDLDSSGFTGTPSGGEAENLNALFEDTSIGTLNGYIGGGQITRVNGFLIKSKKFSILNQGRKTQLGYLDFLVDKTEVGQVDVPIYADYNNEQRINPRDGDSFVNWGIPTTRLPEEASMENESKVWHRLYCQVEAQFFQYAITLADFQLVSKEIHKSEFNLGAIIVWHEKGGRLVR